MSLIFLFIDGVGLAPAGPDNPLTTAEMPVLQALLGGPLVASSAGTRGLLLLKGIDATLGVPGLPQSGTGQTALLAGFNAAEMHGRHQPHFPPVALRPLLAERSVLRRVLLRRAIHLRQRLWPRLLGSSCGAARPPQRQRDRHRGCRAALSRPGRSARWPRVGLGCDRRVDARARARCRVTARYATAGRREPGAAGHRARSGLLRKLSARSGWAWAAARRRPTTDHRRTSLKQRDPVWRTPATARLEEQRTGTKNKPQAANLCTAVPPSPPRWPQTTDHRQRTTDK